MSKKFPLDEFDNLPAHGGRHRIRRTGVDRVREFFRYMIMATIVAGVSFFALTWADSSNIFNDSSPKPTASVDQTKGYSITVLDGTKTDGLAGKLGHKILDAGYTVVAADNASDKVAKTVVYYSNVDFKATAQALLKIVGEYPLQLSTTYSDDITIVLGVDFQK